MAKKPKPTKPEKPEPMAAPTGFAAASDGQNINASWQPVEGASKYSVATAAAYDYNADGIVDEVVEDDYGAKETSVSIPLSDFAGEQDGVPYKATQISLRVKAIGSGKARGRALFSESVKVVA